MPPAECIPRFPNWRMQRSGPNPPPDPARPGPSHSENPTADGSKCFYSQTECWECSYNKTQIFLEPVLILFCSLQIPGRMRRSVRRHPSAAFRRRSPGRQQQPYRGGGHGWDRTLQAQQSAYQQNLNRGGVGPGGYQQRYDQRREDWGDRRDNRGQQQARGFPLPPPSRHIHWNN
ncbi:5'-3' exoribonuclease 2-like isoform X2 [Poecilia latipinna]|uniref:5'-3' exoribonuclease 2-like isoform X2 n=1 Tax=Poecilia latipinna TaxID=48699 RepID=UPI00072D9853|nr:PREDICTED: 5'-3' exoribonuclease 2-like isoform X2 [Poecilia latipinna]